jgi:hypothetical protein
LLSESVDLPEQQFPEVARLQQECPLLQVDFSWDATAAASFCASFGQ